MQSLVPIKIMIAHDSTVCAVKAVKRPTQPEIEAS